MTDVDLTGFNTLANMMKIEDGVRTDVPYSSEELEDVDSIHKKTCNNLNKNDKCKIGKLCKTKEENVMADVDLTGFSALENMKLNKESSSSTSDIGAHISEVDLYKDLIMMINSSSQKSDISALVAYYSGAVSGKYRNGIKRGLYSKNSIHVIESFEKYIFSILN